MQTAVEVTFHGVRGSIPTSCPTMQRIGGNTSCVSIEARNHDPIILDLGTGLRAWGTKMNIPAQQTMHALLTHLHWDHIQGLPFFSPLIFSDVTLNVYGCAEPPESLAEALNRVIAPPFFPIRASDFAGQVNFFDVAEADFAVGDAHIKSRSVPHVGTTNGYRIDIAGSSIAYISDHQQPIGNPRGVDEAVIELCENVDLLIHDAQLWPNELITKMRWGHSTPQYALEVAKQSKAKALALFHHDPTHDDHSIEEMEQKLRLQGTQVGVEKVFAAREGMRLTFAGRPHAHANGKVEQLREREPALTLSPI